MCPRRFDGFSLIEVLFCLVILGLCIVPIVDQFTTIHRVGVSARRLFEVTSHGQMLLEAITQLEPDELPLDPGPGETPLLKDDAPPKTGGSGRWGQVVQFFSEEAPGISEELPADLVREVTATRLASGAIAIRVDLKWLRIGHDRRTEQELSLQGLAMPRTWQP